MPAPALDPDPLSHALRTLSRRWTLEILRLLLERPHRFSELHQALPALSERVMWDRLRELTAAGLIARDVDPGPPITSTYTATSRTQDVHTQIEHLRSALGAAYARGHAA